MWKVLNTSYDKAALHKLSKHLGLFKQHIIAESTRSDNRMKEKNNFKHLEKRHNAIHHAEP